jgi:hypothetical protein
VLGRTFRDDVYGRRPVVNAFGAHSPQPVHVYLHLMLTSPCTLAISSWMAFGLVTRAWSHLGFARHGASAVGRNDACPCGSGKKYKKCHGA